MSPIAKTLALIFVIAGPACLVAQPHYPAQQPPRYPSQHQPPPRYPAQQPSRNPVRQPSHYPAQPPSGQVLPASYQAPVPPGEPVQPPGDATAPVDLTARSEKTFPALAARGQSDQTGQDGQVDGLTPLLTVASSLAVVLGIFFLVAWGMRRAAPRGWAALPGEVFEVLGRAPMANRGQVQLLRCGNKLLLVSVTTTGATTLTEITDPVEVDRVAGICRQSEPNGATAAFRQMFHQFAPRRPQGELLSEQPEEGEREAVQFAAGGALAGDDGWETRDV